MSARLVLGAYALTDHRIKRLIHIWLRSLQLRGQDADVFLELCKHLGMAALVIAASHAIGTLINTYLH